MTKLVYGHPVDEVKEAFLHRSELTRLQNMRKHLLHKNSKVRNTFLDFESNRENLQEHARSAEHHGVDFWKHY